MSQSNNISSFKNKKPISGKTNILVSGCGISWSGQRYKTWVNLLTLTGIHVIDVGGPAVSNQWIINSAAEYVLQHRVDGMVIQLTNLGKLDVFTNPARFTELVSSDSLRNFTIDQVWPSSSSLEHQAKKSWHQWLFSPELELQDLRIKLALLKFYCDQHQIPLLILSGYDIFPTAELQHEFCNLVHNVRVSLYTEYMQSEHYQNHDHDHHNTVPNLTYQFHLLELVNGLMDLQLTEKISKIKAQCLKSKL